MRPNPLLKRNSNSKPADSGRKSHPLPVHAFRRITLVLEVNLYETIGDQRPQGREGSIGRLDGHAS
jgi:hypothetical protein